MAGAEPSKATVSISCAEVTAKSQDRKTLVTSNFSFGVFEMFAFATCFSGFFEKIGLWSSFAGGMAQRKRLRQGNDESARGGR